MDPDNGSGRLGGGTTYMSILWPEESRSPAAAENLSGNVDEDK